MKRKLYYIILMLALFPIFTSQAQSHNPYESAPTFNTLEDKIYTLSSVWSEIKYNFVNIDKVDFDIDSLYRATMNKVIKTTNDIEFYREMQGFVAAFKDGHTYFWGNTTRPYREDDYLNNWPGLYTAIGKHVYFEYVRNDLLYLLGAEILEVDGMPIAEYMEKYILPYSVGSTEESRWLYGAEMNVLGRGFIGREQFVKIRTREGKEQLIPMTFNHLAGLQDNQSYISIDDVVKPKEEFDDDVYVRWMKDNIAVVNIDSFMPGLEPQIDSVMSIVRPRAKGVVLDLRNNYGGSTDVAIHTMMYIVQADSILTYGSQMRINNGYGRAQGNYRDEYKAFYDYKAYENEAPEWEHRSNVEALDCPVVILIGINSASACEDLLVMLYELPDRPVLIGTPTAGTTGAPLCVKLPHNGGVNICTLRETFPYSGKPFIGSIQPDIEVPLTIEDLFSKKDKTIEKGLEILTKAIKGKSTR